MGQVDVAEYKRVLTALLQNQTYLTSALRINLGKQSASSVFLELGSNVQNKLEEVIDFETLGYGPDDMVRVDAEAELNAAIGAQKKLSIYVVEELAREKMQKILADRMRN